MRVAVIFLALALAVIAAGCGGADDRGTLRIETSTGTVELSVELADSSEERRRGLMGRTSLPDDEGMVFLFGREHQGGFWMKGTLIPLSAAFLDRDGPLVITCRSGGRVQRVMPWLAQQGYDVANLDGGMTQSLGSMTEITARLYASMILPMHRHATPMREFLAMMGEGFAVDYRDGRSFEVTLETLPDRPTIADLDGV